MACLSLKVDVSEEGCPSGVVLALVCTQQRKSNGSSFTLASARYRFDSAGSGCALHRGRVRECCERVCCAPLLCAPSEALPLGRVARSTRMWRPSTVDMLRARAAGTAAGRGEVGVGVGVSARRVDQGRSLGGGSL